MCEDKIREPHYKETQYAEAGTPLDVHSGWWTSTQVSEMLFLMRDFIQGFSLQ